MVLKFITSNKHKFKEVEYVFKENSLEIAHYSMKYTELQADSTEQIAMASAANLSSIIDGDFIIEDSGISVNYLNKFPGPYSSYVYQTLGWEGIIELMRKADDRSAYFISVFVMYKDNSFYTFSAKCDGEVSQEGRGDDGFGFDPIFVPNGSTLTFAEMSEEEKNMISHRSKSVKSLIKYLLN